MSGENGEARREFRLSHPQIVVQHQLPQPPVPKRALHRPEQRPKKASSNHQSILQFTPKPPAPQNRLQLTGSNQFTHSQIELLTG